jgi:hypothetical protein
MKSYNFDIAYDATIENLTKLMEKYNVSFMKCIEANGPAGGNPFIEFLFENESDLLKFENDYENGEV